MLRILRCENLVCVIHARFVQLDSFQEYMAECAKLSFVLELSVFLICAMPLHRRQEQGCPHEMSIEADSGIFACIPYCNMASQESSFLHPLDQQLHMHSDILLCDGRVQMGEFPLYTNIALAC